MWTEPLDELIFGDGGVGTRMYLRLERSFNHERQTFVFKLEISREWFIRKSDPGKSLIRWFTLVAHRERKWRERTPGYEEILRRAK